MFIFFATGSIKAVTLNKEKKLLMVSNYLKSEIISFDAIIAVDGSALLSPKLVWIILRKDTQFGRKISFMPAHRRTRSTGKHPIVMKMRKESEVAGKDGLAE